MLNLVATAELRRIYGAVACGLLVVGSVAAPQAATAQIGGSTRVATGLSGPIFATHAPGDPNRLFIAERGGSIRILDLTTGNLLPDPFLDSIARINTSGEGGLLGLAFHPNFEQNGKFYVNVTRTNRNATFLGATANMSTSILEYTVSPDDPNQALDAPRDILSFVQPQNNHNGGWIGFSPNDGYLYIASGDGGAGNDQSGAGGHTPNIGNAQDLYLENQQSRNLLGKMLRIDVDGDDFPSHGSRNYAIPEDNPFAGGETILDDEIWAYGLRNPFRSSFDRATGDLWIGDVGQSAREEIDFQPADSPGGENYGWRLREGTIQTPSVGGPCADCVDPIYDYGRGFGQFQGNAVTGGVVYRGPDPALRGQYLFADFVSENLWMFDPDDPQGSIQNLNFELTPDAGSIDSIAAFGEDADGNVYIVDLGGQVFRIDTAIMLPGDYNGDGTVDAQDFDTWKSQFGTSGALAADGNGDGVVDAADYPVWRDNLGRQLAGGSQLVDSAVPEPATVVLLAAMTLGLGLLRRHGR